jgi:phospholipid/cholesterol/gamma-HCH transport system substrate-binding protein
MIKQASLSGIANRYIDLQARARERRRDPGRRHDRADQTATAVELDQIFNLFDQRTRTALQDFFKGSARDAARQGSELRRGVHYLNPALRTGARLFKELTRDDALLERFLVDSGTLVNALAARRDDLTGVVRNLNATFGALGRQQSALAESVSGSRRSCAGRTRRS